MYRYSGTPVSPDHPGLVRFGDRNKRESFTENYAIRLQRTQIECCDALRVIRSRDMPDAFFYIDPPFLREKTGRGHDVLNSTMFSSGFRCLASVIFFPISLMVFSVE
ncbi:MAG: DNA adenine methylase [Treponema sp.]|nr:DNA adenine methylase [Treponema sp.]